jgi:uncharacterized protein YukE
VSKGGKGGKSGHDNTTTHPPGSTAGKPDASPPGPENKPVGAPPRRGAPGTDEAGGAPGAGTAGKPAAPAAAPPRGGQGFKHSAQSIATGASGIDASAARIEAAHAKLSGVLQSKGSFWNKDGLGQAFGKVFEPISQGHSRAGQALQQTVRHTAQNLRDGGARTEKADRAVAAKLNSLLKGPGGKGGPNGRGGAPGRVGGGSSGGKGGLPPRPNPLSGPQRPGGSGGPGGGAGNGPPPYAGFRRPYDWRGPDGDPAIRRTQGPTGRGATVGYEGRTTFLDGSDRGRADRHAVLGDSSRQLADDTQRAVAGDRQVGPATRPTMAGSFHHDGVVTSHTSVRGGEVNAHPAIDELYERIPEGERSKGHGRCAEVPLLSDRLHHAEQQRPGQPPLTPEQARELLRGGEMTTHSVNHDNAPGALPHGTYVPPCASCAEVIRYLGVSHVHT